MKANDNVTICSLWPPPPPEGRDPMTQGTATGDTSPRWRWEVATGRHPLCPPTICHHSPPFPKTPQGQRPDQSSLNCITQLENEHHFLTPPTIKEFNSEEVYAKNDTVVCCVIIHILKVSELFEITLSHPVTRHKKDMSSFRKPDWELQWRHDQRLSACTANLKQMEQELSSCCS